MATKQTEELYNISLQFMDYMNFAKIYEEYQRDGEVFRCTFLSQMEPQAIDTLNINSVLIFGSFAKQLEYGLLMTTYLPF